MKYYSTILFDLDGTLTDSGPGIMNAAQLALEQYGIAEPDRTKLRRFVGPPLMDSFTDYYGLSEQQARGAIERFRAYYNVTGIYENSPYPGISHTLKRLQDAGRTLAVATSKPEKFARIVLEHFDLMRYFDFVSGATEDGVRLIKADVVAHAMRALDAPAEGTLMVGDREHDVIGGTANGLDTMGVLYGYGSREEFASAGVTYLAQTTSAVADLILGQ